MSGLTVKNTLYTCCPRHLRPYWDRVEASTLGYRLAKGVFWSMAGTVISRGLMLVASILVAQILGKEVFGEYGIIRSTVMMLGVFAGLGLGLTATKHVAEFRTSDPARAGRIIALSGLVATGAGGLMTLALFTFAPWLSAHMLNAPHLSSLLQIGCLLLLLDTLNGVQTGVLAGFEAFRTIAIVNFAIGISAFPLIVGGACFGGLEGIIWGLVVSQAVNLILNYLAIRRECRKANISLRFSDFRQEYGILCGFSLPALLAGVLVPTVAWLCNAMLVNRPNGYAEMGIFNASYQWFLLLLFLPSMIQRVLLPVMSERIAADDVEHVARLLTKLIRTMALLMTPAVLMLVMASPYIMGLYGDGFRDHWPVLAVTLATGFLFVLQAPVGSFIVASGRMWVAFLMNLGCMLTLLGLTFLLIDWGAMGLASARLLAYVVHSIWVFGFVFMVIAKRK